MRKIKNRISLIMIMILLSWGMEAYCALQEDGTDMAQAQREIMAAREAARGRFLEREKQKKLFQEKTKKRLLENEASLNRIKSVQTHGASKKQVTLLSRVEALREAAQRGCCSRKFWFIFLLSGMIGCGYWIYRIKNSSGD